MKFPKWSFDRFDEAERRLDGSMKATGEIMAIGTSFELAFMKAIRSLNMQLDTPRLPKLAALSEEEILKVIERSNNERILPFMRRLREVFPLMRSIASRQLIPGFCQK